MTPYKTILTPGQAEITEKKSRFLCTIKKTETEQEALAFIEQIKKKHWDATHNCYAYIIGNRGELSRCSDDGEPSGTAGRPMLEVLQAEEIHNAAAVVTRYFGGTLLGTGGLVRAYTQAVKAGIESCRIGTMRYGYKVLIGTDYNNIGKILYILGKREMVPAESEYAENVQLILLVNHETAEELKKEMTEATGGTIKWETIEELYFIDKK